MTFPRDSLTALHTHLGINLLLTFFRCAAQNTDEQGLLPEKYLWELTACFFISCWRLCEVPDGIFAEFPCACKTGVTYLDVILLPPAPAAVLFLAVTLKKKEKKRRSFWDMDRESWSRILQAFNLESGSKWHSLRFAGTGIGAELNRIKHRRSGRVKKGRCALESATARRERTGGLGRYLRVLWRAHHADSDVAHNEPLKPVGWSENW